MSRIIFLGNCQASALSAAYNLYVAEDHDRFSLAIDGRHISPDDREALVYAETVAVQVSDLSQTVPEYIPRAARVVRFPYVSGGFLWPFGTEAHVYYDTLSMGKFGVYSGETGDAFLNRLINKGISAQDALDMYMSMDIVRKSNLERRFELSLELQQNRDRLSDLAIAPFIKSNMRREKLFLTRGHLAIGLFRMLASEVFNCLDVPQADLTRMTAEMIRPPFPPHEHPVHPQVANHYGLSYGSSGHRFRLDFGHWTFEDYVVRYMKSEYSSEIYRGLKMLDMKQYVDAAAELEKGIATCPDSAEALSGLGRAYEQLGNQDAAIQMLARAAAADPTWLEPILVIAGILFRANDFDRAKEYGENAMSINPHDRHARHIVGVCDARLAERKGTAAARATPTTLAVSAEETESKPTRIAIIGNANSVMRDSYAAKLAEQPRFKVENWSIGASPNIILLDFLTQAEANDFDVILVETAVMDAIQMRAGCYPEPVAQRNMRRFLSIIRETTSAQVIFLVLPTRFALLEPGAYPVEDMYQSICREYGIPILNAYNVVRDLIGNFSAERVDAISRHAPAVTDAFGLPRYIAYELSWNALRNSSRRTNALGIHAFADDAHICTVMHALIGALLEECILKADARPQNSSRQASTGIVVKSNALAEERDRLFQKSPLISRELVCLRHGDSTIYRCADGYSAIGILLNQTKTSAFLSLESSGGKTVLDCRYPDHVSPWSAIIVPIIDYVGDGDIRISVSNTVPLDGSVHRFPGTTDLCSGNAEIGELIIVKNQDDFWSPLGEPATERECYTEIEKLGWAQAKCREIAEVAAAAFDGVEAATCIIGRNSSNLLKEALRTGALDDQVASRARGLLLMGSCQSALQLLNDESVANQSDLVLSKMRRALTDFAAVAVSD